MGTSKKRGGAKAHRKRVQARNVKVTAERNAFQKLMDESMRMQIEELRKAYESKSGDTQTPEQ